MTVGRIALLALLVAFAAAAGIVGGTARAQEALPAAGSLDVPATGLASTDLLRIEQDGVAVGYDLWPVDPAIVATPDGGAWAFFSAFPRLDGRAKMLRLYGARFDPTRGVWSPGRALPGKTFQFGPTAAVDDAGRVHVVYADGDSQEAASTLLYVRDDGAGGWTAPVPVAPDPNAGYQVTPVLKRDAAGGLHLLWREQRAVSPELRAKDLNNGDVFASDLVAGVWSPPAQVTRRPRPDADVNAGWPLLAVDGDRLIAAWSIYRGTTKEEMEKATRVEWSTRPLTDPAAWIAPKPLIDRQNGEIGGRLVALAADPRGGAVLAYSRIRQDVEPMATDLYLRRLDPGGEAWGTDTALGSGDRGYSLSLALAADGTAYLTYHDGRNRNIEVGGLIVPADPARQAGATLLTADQDGLHGQSAVAVGGDGRPWVVYAHAAIGADRFTEIRSLRGPWPAP